MAWLLALTAGIVILLFLSLAPPSLPGSATLVGQYDAAAAVEAPDTAEETPEKPHIVLAVLDDAGWDDLRAAA